MSQPYLTPIILSQDLNPADAAARTGIHHGRLHSGMISVHFPGTNTVKQIPLPETPFRMVHLGSAYHSAWQFLILWLQRECVQNPLIILDHDHPFRELILYANAWCGLNYGLRFAKPLSAVHVFDYALFTNSYVNVFTTAEIEADFRKKYIGPYRAVETAAQLTDFSNSSLLSPACNTPSSASGAEVGDDASLKLLIVSYFSGPCRSVGVQRPNYWFNEIKALSGGRIEPHLATAVNWGGNQENIHFVPDHNIASLLDNDSNIPDWSHQFIASEQINAKSFNTLSHYWRYALEQYFKQAALDFDVVLISGNPFSCFDFGAFAKRKWYARVILDYRDPFANNPRMLFKDEQRQHARYIECGYNFQSDLVLTVNSMCLGYIEAFEEVNSSVIENGFDESIANDVTVRKMSSDKINLVHAGSLYYDRSPTSILRSMDGEKHRFHHVGGLGGIDDDLLDLPVLVKYGRQEYLDTLGIIGGADCGVVFLSKTAFETTTKVYDYLAMGIDVLLCTHGELNQGALNEILQGHEGIFWCQNTEESVAKFLEDYSPSRKDSSHSSDRFSRKHSTKLLIDNIFELMRV